MELSRLLNEPVAIAAAIRAVLVVAISFGFTLTPEQIGTVMLAVEAVLALVTRGLVTPVALAEQRMERGHPPTTPMGDEAA